MQVISLFPAYGRDYKSAKALLEDWNAGVDFSTHYGYTSKSETHFLIEQGFTHIEFRYFHKTRLYLLPIA